MATSKINEHDLDESFLDSIANVEHTHTSSEVGITASTTDLEEGATLEYGKIYLVLEEE